MKTNLKKIMLTAVAILSTTFDVIGMEKSTIKESELRHSKPLYAAYLSHTARENIENLLNEVMSVLSDQILIKEGIQPWSILNASKKQDFNVDDFIPSKLEVDIREAVRTVAVHYAYLHSVRNILANALADDINLNWEEDIQFLLGDCNFTIKEVLKLKKGNCKVFQATQRKQPVENLNDQYQEPDVPQTRVLYFASVSSPFHNSRKSLSILFMNEPTDDPLKEPLNDQSLTLQQIMNAYQFMKSYEKTPSNNYMSDFIETLSAGTELKDALDCFLGTKHVNLQQGPMYFGGSNHNDYHKRELLAKSEEIKALQAELNDSTLTDQKIRSKLEVTLRVMRADKEGLSKSIELMNIQEEQDSQTGFAKEAFSDQLIEQANAYLVEVSVARTPPHLEPIVPY
jgi:hypothetical protein